MKNLSLYKDQLFLLFSIVVVIAVFFNITNDALKTRASAANNLASEENKPKDPMRNFESLDNFISYSVPKSWQKTDQVDKELGNNTLIALSSPNFESPETFIINKGIRITINRSYDPSAEDTVRKKLNSEYQFYDYNVRAMTIDGKNAMTMHEDYEGHNRFVFIASDNYLWQIGISSKNLDEEQKYESEINTFLNSIKFKPQV